ncbi:hypothetical protein HK099_001011 [Clydaea vesicula]|uniref:Cullin family profile domain-containing protein n=1 Tax=Clydaea vesicula TaxID=447962 RepID=A0AAD5U8A2_9FUNG|nr:hypothetical protein HK099_001011 [Clydaea vesicula]
MISSKGKIRGPKASRSSSNSESDFQEAWGKLEPAINQIYGKNASNLSFEELYRCAYNLIHKKKGERLYEGVKKVISSHLSNIEERLRVFCDTSDHFLKTLTGFWDDHTTCLMMLKDILMYMDRIYVPNANVSVVYDLGLELFRDINIKSVKNLLINTLLEKILSERKGCTIDHFLMKKTIEMLLALDISREKFTNRSWYHVEFEPHFLSASESYYELEGLEYLKECDCSEYLKRVEQRLKEEKDRIDRYLSHSTETKIIKIVENNLIKTHVTSLIEMENSGLVSLITNNKLSDLNLMFKLFGRVENGHLEMRQQIQLHVQKLIREINELHSGNFKTKLSNSNHSLNIPPITVLDSPIPPLQPPTNMQPNPIKWVQEVLNIKDKFDKILETCFERDKLFLNEFNVAFELVVNENPKFPEFVSIFIDESLKKSIKGKSEDEVDTLLDKTIVLFRYIAEKDVFERYYGQHLAKRLMHGKSQSEDAERNVISRLKVECGFHFTTKLEGMFKDMSTSHDLLQNFKEQTSQHASQVDISVIVMTSTFWPISFNSKSTLILPEECQKIIKKFEGFYLTKHTGRKLTWLTNLGTFDIRGEINMSPFAMSIIMMAFNSNKNSTAEEEEYIEYEKIKNLTDMQDNDLKKGLQSLSLGKYKILIRERRNPKKKDIISTDRFKLDVNFSSALNKIKIVNIQSSVVTGDMNFEKGSMENETDRNKTLERVENERKHQVEAAVVRVMKSNKKMEHNSLIGDVMKMLRIRFKPTVALVKKTIESLIERDYLMRDKNDRKIYHYLA